MQRGTLIVLEQARRQRVRRFLYCSSSEVYGNCGGERLAEETTVCAPTTVYGAAKLAGEYYTQAYQRTYGLPVTIVRPFNSYGPRAHHQGDLAEVIPRFVIRALNGEPPVIFGSGSNGRDFTYVTETVRGIALAAENEAALGRNVNIAFGTMVTVERIARNHLRPVRAPGPQAPLRRSSSGRRACAAGRYPAWRANCSDFRPKSTSRRAQTLHRLVPRAPSQAGIAA